MAKVTEKQIKIHVETADGYNSVEDITAFISYQKLRKLGAKRRVYKNTKEVFFLIETDQEITF